MGHKLGHSSCAYWIRREEMKTLWQAISNNWYSYKKEVGLFPVIIVTNMTVTVQTAQRVNHVVNMIYESTKKRRAGLGIQ